MYFVLYVPVFRDILNEGSRIIHCVENSMNIKMILGLSINWPLTTFLKSNK